jgi:hypothetical protein
MSTPQTPKLWRVLASLLLVAFALCATLSAQVINGSITGDVKDASGAYIPKASVTIKSPAIGVNTQTHTNSNGTFFVPSLPPGTYTIAVSAEGFKQVTKTNIVLATGDKLSAGDFVLQVGAAGETVTVEAESAQLQIQSNSGERSDLITGKQLNDLAMNGRMVFDYVKVLPGVISTFNGERSNKGGLDSFSINGARGTQHQLTIDGITNVDNGCNCASQVTINPDAIAEVRVLTSNYQAEYGKAAGGQMAMTTKNGTSEFHGNARWFHRHEGLNAWNWMDGQDKTIRESQGQTANARQPYRYNYVGWQLGGPVVIPGTEFNKKKDKLFFFVNQEYYRQLLPDGFDRVYMPTLDEISGNFSKSTDGHGNPLTVIDPTTGNPFPGNVIPDARINKQMQSALLKIYPRPNTTDTVAGWNRYNYVTSKTTEFPRREDIARVDYQVNQANRLFARYVGNSGSQTLPEGLSPQGISNFMFPGGMFLKEPGYTASTNLTTTISPTMVNDMNFGWTVNWQDINSVNNNVARSKYNIDLPLYYKVTDDTPIPDFSFGGIKDQTGTWSYLGSIPWHNAQTMINFNDGLSKMWGRHTLKTGIFYERARKDQSAWGNFNGQYGFDGQADPAKQSCQTTNPYANALLGCYTSFQQTSVRPRGLFRYTNLEFYLQDTFKITHNLTLDYGMRFAWVQPQYDAKNRAAFFDAAAFDPTKAVRLYARHDDTHSYDPKTGQVFNDPYQSMVGKVIPGSGDPLNGIVYGSKGYPKGGFDDRGIMLQPRFGFAYDPFGKGNTVIRGGFGINHDRFQGNPIYTEVNDNPVTMPKFASNYGNIAGIPGLSASGLTSPLTNVVAWQKNGKVPTVYNFSFGIQQNVGWGTTLDIAYVGSQSRHLSQKFNLNAIPYGYVFTAAAQDPSKYGFNIPTDGDTWIPQIYKDAGYKFMGHNALPTDFLRTYMGFGDIQMWTWAGNGNYNSLQVSANKRFSKGISFGAAYTFSKNMTTSNSDGQWTNIIDPKKYNYALAGWDRPHVLAINYVVDLPKFSKWMGGSKTLAMFTDGFQISGISQFLAGPPATVGGNRFQWANEFFSGSYTEPWQLYLKSDPKAMTGDPYGHLDPNAFAFPGNVGVPTPWPQQYFRTGGTNNSDISIFKNIPLGTNEARYLQLRLEAFNAFNHPQFYGINTDTGSFNPWDVMFNLSTTKVVQASKIRPLGEKGNMGKYFGEYNSSGNERKVQLGMKLYF